MPRYLKLVLIACGCYAMENVLIERYLSGVSAIVQVALFNTLVMIVSWSVVLAAPKVGMDLSFPHSRAQWLAALACAVLFTCAEIAFISSYNFGAKASVVSQAVVVLPMLAILITSLWDWRLPDWRVIGSLMLFFGGVALLSQIPEAPTPNP